MHRLSHLQILEKYTVQLHFSDGHVKIVDLAPILGRGITSELLDLNNFKRVIIEPGGGLEWYNGFDICPNTLREL